LYKDESRFPRSLRPVVGTSGRWRYAQGYSVEEAPYGNEAQCLTTPILNLRHRVPGPQPGIAEIEEALWTLAQSCAAGRAVLERNDPRTPQRVIPPAEARG